MKTKLFTLALAALTIGLLGSCKKDNVYIHVPETPKAQEPLPGEFSVSVTKKVHFSKGNLYAKNEGTTESPDWKWHFYDKQYNFLAANMAVSGSSSYPQRTVNENETEIDLFTWGYDATNSVNPIGNTGIGGHATDGETFSKSEDWGSQIGDGNTWRTLTTAEWQYLFNTRTMTNGKDRYSLAMNGVTIGGAIYKGVFLYPDNYNGDVVSSSMTWDQINAAGIVFLPAAGYRSGSKVGYVGDLGYYWSSTAIDVEGAYGVNFDDSDVTLGYGDARSNGFSVRLITECQ